MKTTSSTKENRQMDMLHGSLFDKMLIVAMPLAACSIIQQLFNSVGIAVAGHFASSQSMAAVGSNSAVISLFVTLFSGISLGANVVISNYIGQEKYQHIPDVVHTAISLALAGGLLFLLTGQVIAHPILVLMGAPKEVLPQAVLYLRIYFLGIPFLMLYDFGASILRSIGDTRRPLIALILSGVVNVVLNLLLVAVFHMDVAGTGLSTVAANGVSGIVVMYFVTHEEGFIRLDFRKLRINRSELGRIIRIGLPAGIQGMVFALANVCIQSSINSFGADAIAGSSAGLNYEYYSYYFINAFAQTTVTFTSQNFGARKYDRCKQIFRRGMLASILIGGTLGVIFVIGRRFFAGIYSSDPEVIDYACRRMLWVLTFEGLTSTYEISGAALRGMGHSMVPAALTVFGSCILRLVWIATVCRVYTSFTALMIVYPISWVITGSMVLFAYFRTRNKIFRQPEA